MPDSADKETLSSQKQLTAEQVRSQPGCCCPPVGLPDHNTDRDDVSTLFRAFVLRTSVCSITPFVAAMNTSRRTVFFLPARCPRAEVVMNRFDDPDSPFPSPTTLRTAITRTVATTLWFALRSRQRDPAIIHTYHRILFNSAARGLLNGTGQAGHLVPEGCCMPYIYIDPSHPCVLRSIPLCMDNHYSGDGLREHRHHQHGRQQGVQEPQERPLPVSGGVFLRPLAGVPERQAVLRGGRIAEGHPCVRGRQGLCASSKWLRASGHVARWRQSCQRWTNGSAHLSNRVFLSVQYASSFFYPLLCVTTSLL